MSSEDAVKRVLAGDKVDPKSKASTSSSRSQDKENREGRERQPDREASTALAQRSLKIKPSFIPSDILNRVTESHSVKHSLLASFHVT